MWIDALFDLMNSGKAMQSLQFRDAVKKQFGANKNIASTAAWAFFRLAGLVDSE
jgi:hypothetical protein